MYGIKIPVSTYRTQGAITFRAFSLYLIKYFNAGGFLSGCIKKRNTHKKSDKNLTELWEFIPKHDRILLRGRV